MAFALMFALSAFVIGPQLSGESDAVPSSDESVDHDGHHPAGTG